VHRAAALLLTCSFALSQVTAPTNSQNDENFVVRISVNLVQVDAVVTDSKGHPVTDLKAEDFEVLQDGIAQKVTNLSYINEGVKREVSNAVLTPKDSRKHAPDAPPPPVKMSPSQVKRIIALVVDDLGLSPSSIGQVHDSLKKFVDHDVQPGDLVAVLRTGGGVGALQQFTTDRRLLYAAIDHVRYNYNARVGNFSINPAPVLDRNQSLTLPAGPPNELNQPSARGPENSNSETQGGSLASMAFEPEDGCFRTTSARQSLAAVRYVVQGLRDMPGRKALVLFSESMQMFEPTEAKLAPLAPESFCDYSRVRESFQKLTDAAERAAVVVYTVDPRGVDPLILGADYNSLQGIHEMRDVVGPIIPNQQNAKRKEYRESQEGLSALAEDTGGTIALHNDMLGAIREAAEDSANYYLLGYHPPPSSFDDKGRFKFHKVEVKVKRVGLKVRSRNGFFGFPGRERSVPALSRGEQFAQVLVSPFSTNDIHLRLTALFSHEEKSFLTTLLYINGSDLTFTQEPDGKYKAVLEAVAITFDEDGNGIDDTQRIYSLRGGEQSRDTAIKNGLILTLQHEAEKPGPYQMRVAIRDATSKKIGTATQFVEVPDLKRKRLAVSGIMLKQLEVAASQSQAQDSSPSVAFDPKGNEAIRIFEPGEKVGWEFQIFNAHHGPGQQPNLSVETRIFRDGSEIARSEPMPVSFPPNTPANRLAASGRISSVPSLFRETTHCR